jgi:AmmeMemoRadiSam system protein B
VAGAFYPANPGELSYEVDRLLAGVPLGGGQDLPRALIAPHAGYAYSGPVAASAFVPRPTVR